MIKYILVICAALLCAETALANGQDVVRVDRYSLLQAKPTLDQQDLLSVIINIDVPAHVMTVGEALNHLLQRSGFSLASINSSDPALPILLNQSLPMVHRHLGPISLRDALLTLAGPAWQLVEDPVNRMVSFQLLDKFSNFRPSVKQMT